jgi:hypothetical protein
MALMETTKMKGLSPKAQPKPFTIHHSLFTLFHAGGAA